MDFRLQEDFVESPTNNGRFDIVRNTVPMSSDMPEPSSPNPVEHARVFVTETFPGDADKAFDTALLNIEACPEQSMYWLTVAEACVQFGAELRRAQA